MRTAPRRASEDTWSCPRDDPPHAERLGLGERLVEEALHAGTVLGDHAARGEEELDRYLLHRSAAS